MVCQGLSDPCHRSRLRAARIQRGGGRSSGSARLVQPHGAGPAVPGVRVGAHPAERQAGGGVGQLLRSARRGGAARPRGGGAGRHDGHVQRAARPAAGEAAVQQRPVRHLWLRRGPGLRGARRQGRGAHRRRIRRDHRAVRGRGGRLRAPQLRPDRVRADVHGPGRSGAAAGPGPVHGLLLRLRHLRPADRGAVGHGQLDLRGARAAPALRGSLGLRSILRAAALLRRHDRRALPGGGDQGLLHARPLHPRLPGRRNDRRGDRHGVRAVARDPLRRNAPRRGQAGRADQGAAEGRPAQRGGVRGHPAPPDARAGDRARHRLSGRGVRRDHAPPRAAGRQGLPDGAGGGRDPRVRQDHRGGRRLRLDDLGPFLPQRPPARGGHDRVAQGRHPVRPGDGRRVHQGGRP